MNMEGVDVIYWINLKRAKERRTHMEKILKDPAFDSVEKVRINAVDATQSMKKFTLPIESILSINTRVNAKEYACLASHLDAIRMFSKSKYETAIILEDDVSLEMKPYWKKTIKQVMDEAPKDWEILDIIPLYKYEMNQKEKYVKLSYPCYSHKFKTKNTCRWSAAAYVIHKRAALKLMKLWNGMTYKLPPNTFHVADYLIYAILTTYTYKTPFFLIRKDNDTQLQVKSIHKHTNITRRAFLSKMKTRRN
jgi:GR25 family glycosyltransferase involved in LPS biosynthesis